MQGRRHKKTSCTGKRCQQKQSHSLSHRECVFYTASCVQVINSLQLQHTFSSIFLSGPIQPLASHAKSENTDFCVV